MDLTIARGLLGDVESLELGGASAPFSVRFFRDAHGFETGRDLPGGVGVRWEYDAERRVRRREVRHRSGTDERSYQWGRGRELIAVDDRGKGRTGYTYDSAGRLAAATFPDGRESVLAPDGAGRVHRRRDGSDRTYRRGGQLEAADGVRYEYDVDGQLRRRVLPDGSAFQYTFDAAGRLVELVRPDATTVTFAYDALGRRLNKTVDGASTAWVWDGDRVLHELPQGKDAVTWLFHPETFAPLAKLDGETRYSVVTDPLGTPEALYDDAGDLAWQMQLDLYGLPRAVEPARAHTSCPFRFPGQYADPETGLHYNRFRYYDPAGGRYISPDPIGLLGGLDGFAYVDDPVTKVDPLGLMEDCDIDPTTKRIMDEHGLTQDSELYRTMNPKYLNTSDMMVEGNPNSVARIADAYNPVRNRLFQGMTDDQLDADDVPPEHRYVPPIVTASRVGPGLNVVVLNSGTYASAGKQVISIRVGDVLDAGGRIYPDTGAGARGVKPLYVTFNGAIPFRFVP
jgi:RHS repeat-associated protein